VATSASRVGSAPPEQEYETLVNILDAAANCAPNQTAIILNEHTINYRQYRHGVAVLARQLGDLGASGQRVVVLMVNSIELSMAIYAIWGAGAATVLLNPFYTERELIPLIDDASPCTVLCDAFAYEKIVPIAKAAGVGRVIALGGSGSRFGDLLTQPDPGLPAQLPRANSLAALQYTGGTTGLPKGALHTHAEFMHTVRQIDAHWPQRRQGDVWLNVAPQFHIWGLCMTSIAPVNGRNALVLIQRFNPEAVLEAIEKHKVTIFAGGPPAIFNGLMGHPKFRGTDFSSLRLCTGGGAPFAIETVRAWASVTGTTICEGYGMSEGSPISLNKPDGSNRVGTVGSAAPLTEVQIVDTDTGTNVLPIGEPGEICVRGPQMMKGYWRRPKETTSTIRDGWVHTGDIGFVDADGFIHIVDRKKDMAIVNGYNVFPREIDEVLFAHPAVQEAAALGVPDATKGETIHAYVVAKAGVSLRIEDVAAYCSARLAKYKVPERIFLVDALPRTPAAKIDKRALRAQSVAKA